MYLFIDTLSDPTYIALFDTKKTIIDAKAWAGKQREFDTLIEEIDTLLSLNTVSYWQLSGIVVIVWPGSFTGTRVTTLIANALNFSFHIPLFPITVGEFFALQDAQLPWIASVTRKECLLWESRTQPPVIVEISQLKLGHYSVLGPIDLGNENHTIERAHNYEKVVTLVSLEKPLDQVHPVYAKDPNVTLNHLHHAH